MPGLTILRVVSNSEIERAEKERLDAEVQARQNSDLILGLSAYMRECWDAARIAKDPINDLMLKAMRQRNGQAPIGLHDMGLSGGGHCGQLRQRGNRSENKGARPAGRAPRPF